MPTDSTEHNFNEDTFQRKLVADKAIKLLTSKIAISPMVIDGDWGAGKTFFCKQLINELKGIQKNTPRTLYIDAFQADHADNPLMTVLGAVLSLLPEGENKTLLEKIVPVARFALTTAGKAALSYMFKQNADNIADEFEEHIQDAANTALDASINALLKDHAEAEANLKALQNTLADIAKESPIIVFVDELDRCRPDFAVHMLEVIKHTFDVPNVKFVLVTNLTQLKAAVNHCYGSLVDAQRYLDKFLKFSFRLPEFVFNANLPTHSQKLASVKHFENCVQESSVLLHVIATKGALFEFSKQLIERNNLSLREVETFARHMEIYQTLSDALQNYPDTEGNSCLQIFGVFFVCFKPELVDSIRKKKTDAIEAVI